MSLKCKNVQNFTIVVKYTAGILVQKVCIAYTSLCDLIMFQMKMSLFKYFIHLYNSLFTIMIMHFM